MIFANPIGLLGLLSLPVILVLHLLRERQNRMLVSHLGLWAFLDNQVRGPRFRRIPLTWLLALHLLLAALLSLAWAQPRLPLPLQEAEARHVVILLDVSTSMRASDGAASRLARAKVEANSLLDGLGPQDVVTVLTFGARPQQLGDSRQDDLGRISNRIAALQGGETGHALHETLALGQAALDLEQRQGIVQPEFYILTDGAIPDLTPEQAAPLVPYPLHWRFFGRSTAGNQAILTLNATPLGNGRYQVFTRVANFGSREATRRVILMVDGEPAGEATLALPPDSTIPQVWQVSAAGSVTVALEGADPLPEDDTASIGLQPGGRMRVALVADMPEPLGQALRVLPEVNLEVIAPQEYPARAAEDFELTIFRGVLPETWPGGQVLLVEPPAGGFLPIQGRVTIRSDAPLRFPVPDPLLEGVDFGGVRWISAWDLAGIPDGFVTLLQAGDAPLLLRGSLPGESAGSTRVLALLADLNSGNFTRHPTFPILLGNLVQELRQGPLPASLATGEEILLPATGAIAGPGASVRVRPPSGRMEEFNSTWPAAWSPTLDPGLYRFEFRSAAGEGFVYVTGVNAGDPVESDLRPRDWTQAPPEGVDRTASPRTADGEPARLDLTPYLLGLAVLLFLAEAILAWR